jgi:arylsulfatase A-like enzyme
MIRVRVSATVALLTIAATAGVANGVAAKAKAERRPNVVMLVVDTLRQDHLGCYGYFRETSPHMDALAGEGVRFAQAITVMPHTLPTHISLFTSRYPSEHGVMMNGEVYDGRFKTLAEVLAAVGYETAAFVAGHPVHSKFGVGKGFQSYQDSPKWKSPADSVGTPAIEWLRSRTDTPFFLWVHLYDPHVPYAPPERLRERFNTDEALKRWAAGRGTSSFEEWADVFDRTTITHIATKPGQLSFFKNLNLYDAEIAFADEVIGTIVSALRERKLLENSLLVILSDHGEGLGEHDFWFHGLHLYEEQILIPLIFRFPGSRFAGRVVEDQASLLDIMPTILEFLGLQGPDGMRGGSLLNVIEAEQRDRAVHYAFSETRVYPPRKPRGPTHWTDIRKHSVRTPSWKLIRTTEGEETLYHLTDDPGELIDRSGNEAKRARRLGKALSKWLASVPEVHGREEPELSEEDREKLRSLGYVD